MMYSLSTLAAITHAPTPAHADRQVEILLTDSRSLTYPASSVFFALRTPNNDGHRYIGELYSRGVRSFVVDRLPDNSDTDYPEASFIKVTDTIAALQAIATYHRRRFSTPVIGITGSRGKTTVKEWLYQLLKDDYTIVRSPRSYNSQIGVPLSIWEMNDDTNLSIFEAGISMPGEMGRLETMIKPDIAIITNIGSEHSRGFDSITDKSEEKAILTRGAQCVIYCYDDRHVREAIERQALSGVEIAWSTHNRDCQLYIPSVERHGDVVTINYSYLQVDGSVTMPLTRDSDIQNAIHCLAVMLYLRRPMDVIAARFSSLSPVDTRLEVLEGVNNCLVVYDGYTSDLHSLAPAIDFMERRLTSSRRQTIILSDMMHETLDPDSLYRSLSQLLSKKGFDRIIGIGEEISRHAACFGDNATFFPTSRDFLDNMGPGDFDHELILIKGAPDFRFNRIAEMLEARKHETVLEVNLESVVHNFNFYRSRVKPTTGIVCMLKASGYGAGAYELAKTLKSQGAAYLAVAVLDEGIDLRKAGITMPIMVLNPKVVNYKSLFAYRLEPEIFSFEMLDEIISEAKRYGIKDYPVHIKLDTGMHRLGFLEEDIDDLCRILKSQDAVKPVSVFSHLAAADEPTMDDYTLEQLDIFDRCTQALQRPFDFHIKRHILNSTGITRFPDHQYDLVRLGICLYGIPTMHDGSQEGLQPVSSLYSVVISIKEWGPGTTIGYSRKGLVTRPSRIATVPIGYADGIDRHLGNGNMKVWINGTLCPTIGNICMDACMIDVTGADCEVGDRVELFGPHIPVTALSDALGTIPYEVLTSISSRVKRVYFRE